MLNKFFFNSLEYIGRKLEIEGKHVWGTTGIIDDDGKVHLYFSAWDQTDPHASWVISCKVYHAVASNINSDFKVVGVALQGRDVKSWETKHGNRKYGLAISDSLIGEYKNIKTIQY